MFRTAAEFGGTRSRFGDSSEFSTEPREEASPESATNPEKKLKAGPAGSAARTRRRYNGPARCLRSQPPHALPASCSRTPGPKSSQKRRDTRARSRGQRAGLTVGPPRVRLLPALPPGAIRHDPSAESDCCCRESPPLSPPLTPPLTPPRSLPPCPPASAHLVYDTQLYDITFPHLSTLTVRVLWTGSVTSRRPTPGGLLS